MGDRENSSSMATVQQFVDIYAEDGLRTLLLAKKDLDAGYYEQWNNRF